MCGRYALALSVSEVRRQLEESQMPVDDAPKDEEFRQRYNLPPHSQGLVYRAEIPDYLAAKRLRTKDTEQADAGQSETDDPTPADSAEKYVTKYKLQLMKWGLVPSWSKSYPHWSETIKTSNCRDDSLYEGRSMWNSMKRRKRCIVVAQGFYEWLKKNDGKVKIPHYTKRKDGQLMCIAGLWDCVKFEGNDGTFFSYTIITTNSNKQLSFLHDRMPVILENGSEAIRTWLDPERTEWNKELQSLLKPYEGELECYQVTTSVGSTRKDSPSFVVPVDSAENKGNIANFFRKPTRYAKGEEEANAIGKAESDLETKGFKVEHDVNETRDTTDQLEGTEDNAPMPTPAAPLPSRIKRERSEGIEDGGTADGAPPEKRRISAIPGPASQSTQKSPGKATLTTRSATSNSSAAKGSPRKAGDGNRKITSFFSK